MLTTKVKNHRILFKDDRDPVYITEQTYDAIWDTVANGGKDDMIRLHDEDNNLLYSGRVWQIKEIEKCKVKSNPNNSFICHYGLSHYITGGRCECNCIDIYGESFEFTSWIYQNYHIYSDSEITDEMRKSYLQNLK